LGAIFLSVVLATFCQQRCAEAEEVESFLAIPEDEVEEEILVNKLKGTSQKSKQEIRDSGITHLWKLILQELPLFLLAAVCVLLSSMIGIKIQILLGAILDEMKGAGTIILSENMYKFGGMIAAETVLQFMYAFLITTGSERVSSTLRQRIFNSMLSLDIGFFDTAQTGDLLLKLDDDVTEIRRALKYLVSDGLRYGTQIVGGAATLYFLSPHLTFVTALAVPVLVLIGHIYGRYLRRLSKEMHSAKANAFSISYERVQNIKTIRAFGNEDKEFEKYAEVNTKEKESSTRFGIAMGAFRGMTFFAVNGLAGGLLAYGSFLAGAGHITAGLLTSFLVTALAFQRSVGQISVLMGKMSNGLAAASRIGDLLDIEATPLRGGKIVKLVGNIEFKDIVFSYPSRPNSLVFNGINFQIKAGEVIALVGPTGSGKVTSLNHPSSHYATRARYSL